MNYSAYPSFLFNTFPYPVLSSLITLCHILSSQVTIPKEIIVKLGLSEGDKLDIFEKDGSICIMPVVVYPKKYVDELREELDGIKAKIASGEQPVFDSVDSLFNKLEDD